MHMHGYICHIRHALNSLSEKSAIYLESRTYQRELKAFYQGLASIPSASTYCNKLT